MMLQTNYGGIGRFGNLSLARVPTRAHWFDGIGRLTESADYGNFAGFVPNPPSSAPVSTDNFRVSQNIFNADGGVEKVIDPLGKVDKSEFDDAGRTIKVTSNFGGTDTETVHTEYDKGRMSKQIAENPDTNDQETEYAYGVNTTKISSNDLLSTTTYPDSGKVLYKYNRQSDRIQMTDQNQTTHVYALDKLGRMVSDIVLSIGTSVDDRVESVQYTFDNRRRLQKVTSYPNILPTGAVSEIQFEYDDFGQVVTEYQEHAGTVDTANTPSVQYDYEDGSDNHIRIKSITYPDGQILKYQYGSADSVADRLSRVESLEFDGTDIASYQYLGMNRVAVVSYSEPTTDIECTIATGSGSTLYNALDRFGNVSNLVWQQGSSKLVDYDYVYDRVNNKVSQEVNNSPTNTDTDEWYGYDELYRLTDFDRGKLVSGSITNANLTQDWTLDETGNWKTFDQGVTGALSQSRSHNEVNEIAGITTSSGTSWNDPGYDDNGNMDEIPIPENMSSTFAATWDAWNRLVKLDDGSNTVAEYEYDGVGRRIVKKVYDAGVLDETRHCYYSNQSQCLEERVDSSSDPSQQFVWGIRFVDDLILRDRDTTGNGMLDERLYSLCDPRFSVVAIADTTGSVLERYVYDAYGKLLVFSPTFSSLTSSNYDWEFTYTGRRLDLESGLYFFRARYYHAELGVFASRDPLGYIDGMSLYRGYFIPGDTDPGGTTTMIADIGDLIGVLKRPFAPGWCRFHGCNMDDIIVIPENGKTPQKVVDNEIWIPCDGIIYRGWGGGKKWYKVPDHCAADFDCDKNGKPKTARCRCSRAGILCGGGKCRWQDGGKNPDEGHGVFDDGDPFDERPVQEKK